MSDNPYLKKLKLFNPKSDLQVNELFSFDGASGVVDILGSPGEESQDSPSGGDAGKETVSLRVGAPVRAGVLKIAAGDGRPVIIACDTAGGVYILSPGQGSLTPLARFKIPGSIVRTPAYADGILYLVTREGLVAAVNTGLTAAGAEGKINPQMIWQKKLEKGILTEPLATGKLLFVAALDGLYAFEAYYRDKDDKAIGKELWRQPMNGTTSSPFLDGGIIYLGSEEKKLYAFEYGGNRIGTAWQFDANAQIRCRPHISPRRGNLLFSSMDGSVYCVNREQKKLQWVFLAKAPVYGAVVSEVLDNDEFYFVGADNGYVFCLNSQGREAWKYKTNGKVRCDALLHNGVVYFGSEDNNLYAFNARNGNLLFKFSTDGNINGTPVIEENQIFFGSTDSFVHGVGI